MDKKKQQKTFGTKQVDVVKFGKYFEKISIGLLNPKTLDGNRFIRLAIISTAFPNMIWKHFSITKKFM